MLTRSISRTSAPRALPAIARATATAGHFMLLVALCVIVLILGCGLVGASLISSLGEVCGIRSVR